MLDIIDYDFNNIIDVQTGEVKTGGSGYLISANAIGSCVAAIAFNQRRRLGGIAHIMLPGRAPFAAGAERSRYAHEGLTELLRLMRDGESEGEPSILCLAGGANILKDPDDNIARENCLSVLRICAELRLPVRAKSLGGFCRRKVILDVDRGCVFCSIKDKPYFILWNEAED